jgi:hypothetical protein
MTFGSTFGRTFSPTFQPKSQTKKGGVIVHDTFTDTDNTMLSSHTPEVCPSGSTWGGGTTTTKILIISNELVGTNGSLTGGHCGIETGVADCIVTATIKAHSVSGGTGGYQWRLPGIKVRCNTAAYSTSYSDTQSYYLICIDSYLDKFYILEKASGNTWTAQASASVSIDYTSAYVIKATLSGSTITATLNGANEISYASATSNQTSTIHGVHPSRDSDTDYNKWGVIRDFLVET